MESGILREALVQIELDVRALERGEGVPGPQPRRVAMDMTAKKMGEATAFSKQSSQGVGDEKPQPVERRHADIEWRMVKKDEERFVVRRVDLFGDPADAGRAQFAVMLATRSHCVDVQDACGAKILRVLQEAILLAGIRKTAQQRLSA